MYIAAGSAIIVPGGIYVYNNISFSENSGTEQHHANISNGRSSLVDALLGNVFQLVKNTPNILRSVSTVTGQVSNPEQYVAHVTIPATTTQQKVTEAVNENATEKNILVDEPVQEPVQLKVASEESAETPSYNFSTSEGETDIAKDKLFNIDNGTNVNDADTTASSEKTSVKNVKKPVKNQEKKSLSTRKKIQKFFSKEAFQH